MRRYCSDASNSIRTWLRSAVAHAAWKLGASLALATPSALACGPTVHEAEVDATRTDRAEKIAVKLRILI